MRAVVLRQFRDPRQLRVEEAPTPQIAKARGATAVGVVRSDDDSAAALRNGADHVINSRTANLAESVRAITSRGADIVFDTTGMMFAEAIETAGMGGRLPVITASADGKASFNLRSLYRKVMRVQGGS